MLYETVSKFIIEHIKMLLISLGGFALYLFGHMTEAMFLLVTLIFLDFCTGVLKATYQKKLNSKIGHIGILKKVGLLFCIVIAHMTDLYLNSGTLIRDITINMFIVMEILSNLENLSSIDRLFPRFLRNLIKEYLETKR